MYTLQEIRKIILQQIAVQPTGDIKIAIVSLPIGYNRSQPNQSELKYFSISYSITDQSELKIGCKKTSFSISYNPTNQV